jgi:hypothetical protein
MKSKLIILLLFFAVSGLIFSPACKSGCDYSILGTWSIVITIPGWYAAPSMSWTETLTFSGTDESGTITGWAYAPGQVGTFTVTDCNLVQILYNYIDYDWGNTNIIFNGTLTTDTTMNGTGTWDDDWGLENLNWSGNKVL